MQIGFELHVRSETRFPKLFGKRVMALGGRYSECRGYQDTRFVKLPLSRRSIALVEEILAALPTRTVMFRSRHRTIHGKPLQGTILCQVVAAAQQLAPIAREARAQRWEDHLEGIRRRRARDQKAVETESLEAGERLAAEWIQEALTQP